MGVGTSRQVVRALSLGPEAVALRDADPIGSVIAVTRGAVYLASDQGNIVGIVGSEGVDGPLTLRVSNLSPVSSRLAPGQPFTIECGVLRTGDLAVDLRYAATWTPLLPPQPHSDATQGLTALAALLREHISRSHSALHANGYTSWIVASAEQSAIPPPDAASCSDPLSRRIVPLLGEFGTSLLENKQVEAEAALVGLVGLGPGLTPSGDDITAGVVAALHWHDPSLAREPGERVLLVAQTRTNRISARMLHYGAGGLLYEPAMQLGVAILSDDIAGLRAPLARLLTLGASTGLDLAGGILFGSVLELLLSSQG